jgi:hypothetical protein
MRKLKVVEFSGTKFDPIEDKIKDWLTQNHITRDVLVDIQYSVVYNPDDSDINKRSMKYALIFYETMKINRKM